MQKETPAIRLMKRTQLIVGGIVMLIVLGVPAIFLLEIFSSGSSFVLIAPMFVFVAIGTSWMNSVKCPKCQTTLRGFSNTPTLGIPELCRNCGRPTNLPY